MNHINFLRLLTCLVIVSIGSVCPAANTYSQSTPLTLKLQDATLSEALSRIESQSEFIFFYYEGAVNTDKKVSIDAQDKTVDKILDELLQGTGSVYTISGRQVYISKASEEKEVLSPVRAVSQQPRTHTVTGTVTDSNGESLIGVSVRIKGTTRGTITNADGRFSLEVPANATLEISYIGYVAQEVAVGNRTSLNIQLKEDSEILDEVIVTAFGNSTRQSFTGSASVMKSETLEKRQVTNVMEALKGQAAGVQMYKESNQPDSEPTFLIRGLTSINASSNPLIILDGAPFDGGWNNINPNDVESVTVLKDAASNALYGARGAGGVIMVTTKKAAKGSTVITFDARIGANHRVKNVYDVISQPGQFYELQYKALYNYYTGTGATPWDANQRANNTLDDVPGAGGLGYMAFTVPDGENLIGSDGKLNPSATLGKIIGDYLIIPDDYFKEAFRTGVRQEYNLSINGGNDKATYYTSFGYLNNEGIVPGSEYERITGKINASWTANDWLTTGVNANYSHSKRNGVDDNYQTSVFSFATIMGPIYPLYIRHADGSFYTDDRGRMYDYGNGDNAGLQRGPISNSNALQTDILDVSGRVGNSITAQAYADIRFLKDFKFTVNINVANDQRRSTAALNPWYGYNAMYDGYINKAETRVFSVNTQQLLNWGKTFGHHDISAMVGHEYYDWRTEYLDGVKTGALDYKGKPELSAAILISSTDSYAWYYNTEGYFGRALYDYNKQYFASMSFRRDGSSRFHPDHRWGNFWSLGGAWLINKETWFDASWVDMLKLKASYGEQGNDNLGTSYEYQYYLYTDMYSIANNANTVALPFYQKGNKEITWEKNGNFNAGVEFELFKGRLTGNFEYFYRKTSDMLTYFSLPISRGYAGYYDNVGDMTNNGLELSLTGTVLKMKDLKWDISLNTTWYKNKVTLLNEERKTVTIDGYNGYVDGYYFVAEGQPRYTWYLRQYAGPDPTTGQSTWYYTDKTTGELKTTTNWSNADYHLCGTPTPDLYGGFSTNLTWKDFDLSANFSYQIGGLVYDSAYSSLMRSPTTSGSGTNMHVDVLQSWTPENTQTDIPRWYYSDIAQDSDRWLINGSYLSMENITLGYTLPASLIKKAGINSLRLSVSCDNVFFLSKRNGLDPRYNIDGSTSGSTYTPIRSISGGIKIQF